MSEPTVYEASVAGRSGVDLPDIDVPHAALPSDLVRDDLPLPEMSQLDVVRHYLRLSQRNFGVDSGFYPLGSCTMKYNPRINEDLARLAGFAHTHPLGDPDAVQGNLALMHELQDWLAKIGGFHAVSLQPSAGAHGELTALLMMRAWFEDRGEGHRRHVLIPDTAHGTNPASTTMAGLVAVEIPSDRRGNIELKALEAACGENVVGLMITNPNTLGLFEEHMDEIAGLVHGCGGLVYGDGANMNALCGIVRPADLGVDLMHYNLHKTFATPHGGGGPGSGPLAAREDLAPYLPGPVVEAVPGEDRGMRFALRMPDKSIGRMCAFHGNFGMFVRALAYLKLHGAEGLRINSEYAVLNANYLRVRLRETYNVPYDRISMHEFVCQGSVPGTPVRAIDVAKRLLDYGFHPPTNYFPLTVAEALMVEPTETESRQTLDAFVEAMAAIAAEAGEDPDRVLEAPHSTPVGRLDEVRAARRPVLAE